ncbi:endonuclease/exonuclease/phosphatase family protein [bacterium]|nr:endonuclease/exonuclease/phosphatase family protein [bacterium]
MRYAVIVILLFVPSLLTAQTLLVDGQFEDWASFPVLHTDATGDGGTSGVDFRQLQITHDDEFLFLSFETTAEVVLQEDNTLRLYMDTDHDASTGQQVQGLGAELSWNFAGRSGTVRLGSQTRSIAHEDIGLYPAPTYSSTRFEIALRRNARIAGSMLFPSDSIRVALAVVEAGGDRLPDVGGVEYGFDSEKLPAPEELLIGTKAAGALRLLTWNTLQDGLIDDQRKTAFTRVLQAVQPDIMCFQECFDATAGQVLLTVRSVLDPPAMRSWRTLKLDQGNVLITHYDIEDSWILQNNYRESAYLLASPEGKKLLLLNCHFRCCSANEQRQQEADGVIRFLRDAMSPGGEVALDEGTPIVLVGDLNLVGDRRQLETLLTGDIADNARYGEDWKPDWDGGNWTQCISRRPHSRLAHTWDDDGSSYAPSILDYVLYTGSAMHVTADMVISTGDMGATQLQQLGLRPDDTRTASDHLPRYADFVWKDATGVSPTRSAAALRISALWPQPALNTLSLRMEGSTGPRTLRIRDVLGRTMLQRTDVFGTQLSLDISTLLPGSYFLELRDAISSVTRPFMVR